MESKVCTKCGEEKPLSEYYFRKSRMIVDAQCKPCLQSVNKIWREKNKDKVKEWREKKKEELKLYNSEYRKNNIERLKKLDKTRYENKKEDILNKAKEYYKINKESIQKYKQDNKDKLREYRRSYNKYYKSKRMETDPIFKFRHKIKSSINRQLKKYGYTKKSKTYEILGCSYEDFKKYLESKFQDWMTWDNHGIYNGTECYGWDIDHIIPASTAKTEEDVIRLNHYTNLQPLCSYINRAVKKDRIEF